MVKVANQDLVSTVTPPRNTPVTGTAGTAANGGVDVGKRAIGTVETDGNDTQPRDVHSNQSYRNMMVKAGAQ